MKNMYLKPILMTGLMLPSLAMAAGPTWTTKLKNMLGAQRQTNQKLNKASGLSIESTSLQSIKEAVDGKLGGSRNVNIDLGNAGGVLIGSGADGLVATSNESRGGPVVIHPPAFPMTSITVVGRAGIGQKTKSCASRILTNTQGEVLKSTSLESDKSCANLGTPIHLEPGKYLLEYSNSYSIIDLASLENKVVPLREVSVSYVDGKYSFEPVRETCSLVEIDKTATYVFATYNLGGLPSIEVTKKYLFQDYSANPNRLCLLNDSMFGRYSHENEIASGKDGDFFSVLPGVYKINWRLPDGQTPAYRNITVE